MPLFSSAHWLTLHGAVTLIAVALYTITAHVMQQRRHPAAAIAWVLFILLVPYIALPAFLTFGSRKQPRTDNDEPPKPATDVSGPWAIQTALALGQPAPVAYERLHIHAGGRDALLALRRTIEDAQHSIDLCTFILGRDPIGKDVVERLAAKARAGVKVRLMLDGLGSMMSRRPSFEPLDEAGAEHILFVPPIHAPLQGRSNLRDHRKLLIADAGHPNARLWCGGRNLATEYFDGAEGTRAWHDLTFDIAGPFVEQARQMFEHDWAFAHGRKRRRRLAVSGSKVTGPVRSGPAATAGAAPPGMRPAERPRPVTAAVGHAGPGPQPIAGTGAQLIASGPDQVDDTVYSLAVTAAYRATRRIAMVTPYFVPDAALLAALCLAARRGVEVDLLIPQRSNHRMSDIARRRALRALAAAGGRLWTVPHMIHAKLIVVDDVLALAGSANLDSRSLFLNYELMAAFHDPEAIAGFSAWFAQEQRPAKRLRPRRARFFADIAEGLVLWTGFQL